MVSPQIFTLTVFTAVAAPSDGATSLWYREVFLGDFTTVSDDYKKLYLGRAPFEKTRESEKRWAALRAGICFERQQKDDDARLAYDWLSTETHPPPLERWQVHHDRVQLRIQNLKSSGAEDPVLADRVEQRTGQVLATIARGERMLQQLHDLADWHAIRRRVGSELQRRLGEEWQSTGDSVERSSRSLEEVANTVAGFSEQRTSAVLANVLSLMAGRSLAAQAVAQARIELRAAHVFAKDVPLARDLTAYLDIGLDYRVLKHIAENRVRSEILRQVGELQSELRELIYGSRSVIHQRPRLDLALSYLVDLFETLSWALPEVRRDPEIVELEREATFLGAALTVGTQYGNALRTALAEREAQVQRAMATAADLTQTAIVNEGVLARLGQEASPRVVAAGQDLLDGLLAEATETGADEALRQARVLVDWLPELEESRGLELRRLERRRHRNRR